MGGNGQGGDRPPRRRRTPVFRHRRRRFDAEHLDGDRGRMARQRTDRLAAPAVPVAFQDSVKSTCSGGERHIPTSSFPLSRDRKSVGKGTSVYVRVELGGL